MRPSNGTLRAVWVRVCASRTIRMSGEKEAAERRASLWWGLPVVAMAAVAVWLFLRRSERAVVAPKLSRQQQSAPAEVSIPRSIPEPAPTREARALVSPSRVVEPPADTDIVEDSDLSDAIPMESVGPFTNLYSTWSSEPVDAAATADAKAFFRTAFATYAIHAESASIGCGTSLCRARFRFADLKELYKMNQIDQADGVKIATTFPLDEGEDQTVSIYWSRNPHPEGNLVETAGQ